MEFKFQNGDKVKDKVTGLTGIVTATTFFLNSCIRYLVQPQELKDGKPVDTTYFDESDLVLMKPQAVPENVKETRTGGPTRYESKMPSR